MNYLAHFLLSEENEKLIIGNLIADSLKGSLNSPQYQNFDLALIYLPKSG